MTGEYSVWVRYLHTPSPYREIMPFGHAYWLYEVQPKPAEQIVQAFYFPLE